MQYIGRFAPSPTGPLHFGSLLAAVASYLEAKIQQGKWLVRMEDLDKPREMDGAAKNILSTLVAFGFEWDGQVMYQSQRDSAYTQALATLKTKHFIYPCTCTRKEIADSSIQQGIEGAVYPKTCLHQPIKQNHPMAWRVKTNDKIIGFDDVIQGHLTQNIAQDIGDFVLKRADGLFAYQLAVVVDDAEQGITHVVRGADLLNSTPRQLYLQSLLGFETPHYLHIPVAVNADGQKLSKQTLALGLNTQDTVTQLWEALSFLNQQPPEMLKHTNLTRCWEWAVANWDVTKISKVLSIKYPSI
jgi:glutamyl-Q tRNA(Asp) synthetase